ncbi:MAG: HDOD domain-containing protein, partial [Myxococcota bacterium]
MSTAPLSSLTDSIQEALWFGDEDPHRTEEEAATSLAAAVGTAIGLKPFPAAAARAMQQLSDPEAELDEIVNTLESDPALATHLLRTANAAAFASAVTV